MPAKKGMDNFLSSRNAKQEFIRERINHHLEELQNNRRSRTLACVKDVAEEIRQGITDDLRKKWEMNDRKGIRPRPMAIETFYTNKSYRLLIENFINSTKPARGTNSQSVKTDLSMANARIYEQDIKISNLKNEISVLKRYIENSGSKSDEIIEIQHKADQNNPTNDFAQTARALSLLIEALQGSYILDSGNLIYAGRISNNIIADKKTMAPFISWLKLQKSNDE